LAGGAELNNLRPSWWGDDGPTLTTSRVILSSDPNTRRMRIDSKLPFLSYLNQIMRKVDRPQRNPRHPYLIVLDQYALPMRHKKLTEELSPWLAQWDHISGILCFDPRAFFGAPFCWHISFHPNPGGAISLPHAISRIPQELDLCVDPFVQA
jgi:hypothetical protein